MGLNSECWYYYWSREKKRQQILIIVDIDDQNIESCSKQRAELFLSPRRESKSYFSFNKLIFYKCNYKLIVSIAKIINEWGEGKIQGYYINIIYDSQIFSKNRNRYIIILLLFSSFEKWNRFVGKINSAIIFEKYRRFEVFQENI